MSLRAKDIFHYVLEKLLLRRRLSILMYHSIDDNEAFFTVTPDMFRWQMEYLKKSGRTVMALDEVVGRMKAGKALPRHTVVITFDDGYRDNLTNAYPILKEYGYPASIYCVADRIGISMTKRGIVFAMLGMPDIQKLDREGLVSIESHTKSHRKLTKLPLADANLEMAEGAQGVAKYISGKCLHFAYPYGDYNEALKPVARQLFKSAVTVKRGFVGAHDDLYELKRNSIDSAVTKERFRWLV